MVAIKGLYETHLYVEDLERSCAFYSGVLELKLCHREEARKAAFFWIGEDQQQMLGLWQKPINEIDLRHFAFNCELDWILHESVPFLKSHNIIPHNFLKDGTQRPMVFAWMPALSIYFTDPDGHSLEFIAILDGSPQADAGVMSYDDWLKISGRV